MGAPRYELARDIAAIVVLAIACPAALFGGALAGCAAEGFADACAANGVLLSPLLLVGAGLLGGLLTRGWFGYAIVFVGVVAGMFAILILTTIGGSDPVPLDPITAMIATIWFLAPVTVGYAFARFLAFGYAFIRGRSGKAGTGGTADGSGATAA
jgi:hypothetical protein